MLTALIALPTSVFNVTFLTKLASGRQRNDELKSFKDDCTKERWDDLSRQILLSDFLTVV
jgi:hypothetical protein